MDLKTNIIKKGKFLNMFQTENGWEFVSRKEVPFRDGNTKVDAIIIVPVFLEKGRTRIALCEEWREPLNGYVFGFPAGLVDEGEDIYQAAKRELKEETGLDVEKVLHVSPMLFSSEGLTDECVKVIYVSVSGLITNKYLQENEDITTFISDRIYIYDLLYVGGYRFGKVAYFVLLDFANTGFKWLEIGENERPNI